MITVKPPASMLTPCTGPASYDLKTNADLAHFASSALLAWQSCAAQIDALRRFFAAADALETDNNTQPPEGATYQKEDQYADDPLLKN